MITGGGHRNRYLMKNLQEKIKLKDFLMNKNQKLILIF